jgi:putative AdoMet-dependent methyltransferase
VSSRPSGRRSLEPAAHPFPSSDFDAWAGTYDHDVTVQHKFPFDGYDNVLDMVVQLSAPTPGMTVLDLGTGTGNLAARFAARGCNLWCTDFSNPMLEKARQKLPSAHLVLHELQQDLPDELSRRFDRIVSAYAFHHLSFHAKLGVAKRLVVHHLEPSGRMLIADISFPNPAAMYQYARSIGDQWEQEPYWLADETLQELKRAGLKAEYRQLSACAGIYCIEDETSLRR